MKIFLSFIFVFIILSGIFTVSCKPGYSQKVNDKYLITSSKIDSILANNDTNILILYTSWCGGAKETIDGFYKEVLDSIISKGLNNRIVLLLADDRIDTNLINKQRSIGFLSYGIKSSGNSAIDNRNSIMQYIDNTFPDQKVDWLQIGFKIPVELMISPNRKIVNVSDESLAFKYSVERFLGLKIGKTENNPAK